MAMMAYRIIVEPQHQSGIAPFSKKKEGCIANIYNVRYNMISILLWSSLIRDLLMG